jgi:hypothetical protein
MSVTRAGIRIGAPAAPGPGPWLRVGTPAACPARDDGAGGVRDVLGAPEGGGRPPGPEDGPEVGPDAAVPDGGAEDGAPGAAVSEVWPGAPGEAAADKVGVAEVAYRGAL